MIHAAVAALSVTLALVGLPNCTDINAGAAQPFGGSSLVLATADGAVSSSIPLGNTWFRRPDAAMRCNAMSTGTGRDSTGPYDFTSYGWGVGVNGSAPSPTDVDYETVIKAYTQSAALGFVQRWPKGAEKTGSGDADGVISAFPALMLNHSGTPLGFAHFSGFMAADYPQYGPWTESWGSVVLEGGIKDSGMLAIFDANATAGLVISPASSFMAASLAVRNENTSSFASPRVVEWGVMGDAQALPAGFEAEWLVIAHAGGPTEAVRAMGAALRAKYNRPSEEASHNRDVTLRTLGYATDNGAYYYYWTGPNTSATYDDVMRDVKAYSLRERIPYRYVQLDSWWYYRQDGADKSGVPLSGVSNWTAMPSVFPEGGLPGLYENITNWPVMAHNRYWATDNVYASNPEQATGPTEYAGKKFDFAWGIGAGLPTTEGFWDYLFSINANWGLVNYLQDWLSLTTNLMPQLNQNVTFGREWLRQMGRGAAMHDVSVLYCMSFPRHVFQALEIPSVTQARASNDYQPQSNLVDHDQWRIGDSSLFVTALGLAPSKDNFWSMPTPQLTPHYDPYFPTRETRNRLESLTSTLSNGIVQISDRVGFTNRSLVIRACDAGGRLLRPATAATPIDRYYAARAFGAARSPNSADVTGVVHTTHSAVTSPGYPHHGYLFAAKQTTTLFINPLVDMPAPLRADAASGAVSGWLVYESNSTAVLGFVSASDNTAQIAIPANDEYSFQFYTFAPVPTGAPMVLVGEQNKWIAGSAQRYSGVATQGNVMTVQITGAAGEEVETTFAAVSTTGRPTISYIINTRCTISESLVATVVADGSNGSFKCQQ